MERGLVRNGAELSDFDNWVRGQVVKRDAFQGRPPLRNVWRATEYVSEGLTLLSLKATLFNGMTPADAIVGDIGFRAYLSAIRVSPEWR